MCGRFTLTDPDQVHRAFGRRFRFEEISETRIPARFNIAPTQAILGVRNDGRSTVEPMRWGIDGLINARSETISTQTQRNRCIVFADGFYEWTNRKPMYFTTSANGPFALAGIWATVQDALHCAIITCQPNALVATVHDRMPVILAEDTLDTWLGEDVLPADVMQSLLQPYAAAAMSVRSASRRLNNARYDAPDVLDDNDPVQQGFGFVAGSRPT